MIGTSYVLHNVDIYGKVGKGTAYDEYLELDLRNNKVYYQDKPLEGALDSNALKVTFKKGERDNPKINSILLVKGTLRDTDYEYYKGQLDELERQRSSKERVKTILFNIFLATKRVKEDFE